MRLLLTQPLSQFEDFTRFFLKASETGDPEYVRGSYRVKLPDGRTQIVTYEVHKDQGYQATVTYEGEASYPDTPASLEASPYKPPIRKRTPKALNDLKYKRQSSKKDYRPQPAPRLNDDFFAEVYGESRLRPERKLPSEPLSSVLTASATEDLQLSPSHNILTAPLYREKYMNRKRKKVLKKKKLTRVKSTNAPKTRIYTSTPPPTPALTFSTLTQATDPTTELEEVISELEDIIQSTEAGPLVTLPEFVGTATSLSQKSSESHVDKSTTSDNSHIVSSTANLEISVLTDPPIKATLPPNLFYSLHSSTTPSPPDYDQEDLKEIEVIGNTVSDDDDEYFEDYYNFPFGSRITSVISNDVSSADIDATDGDIPLRSQTLEEVAPDNEKISYSPVHDDDVVRLVVASGNTFVPEHYTV